MCIYMEIYIYGYKIFSTTLDKSLRKNIRKIKEEMEKFKNTH